MIIQTKTDPVWRRFGMRYGPLDGYKEADFVIVGGGIVGSALLYELSKAGYKTILLEKDKIGSSATGRSTGILIPEDYEIITTAEQIGLDNALLSYRTNIETVKNFEQFANEIGLTSYRKAGALSIILKGNRAKHLTDYARNEIELRKKYGFPVPDLLGEEARTHVGSPRVVAAMFYHGNEIGNVDPQELVDRLVFAAIIDGGIAYENTTATRINEKGEIETDKGLVVSKRKIIIATGGVNLDGTFSNSIIPGYGHVIATNPLTRNQRDSIGFGNNENAWTAGVHAYDYMRPTFDGRLVYGGQCVIARGRRPAPDKTSSRRFETLKEHMIELFPTLDGVGIDNAWVGILAFSPDLAPVVEYGEKIDRIHSITAAGIVKGLTISRLMVEELKGEKPEYLRMIDSRRSTLRNRWHNSI